MQHPVWQGLHIALILHYITSAANIDKQKRKILPMVGFGSVHIYQSQDFDFVCV